MDKLDSDGPLMIAAEQLTTSYELAKDEGVRGDELHAVVARLMDTYAAERERAARRVALEQACKAVCFWCAEGVPIHWEIPGAHEYGDMAIPVPCDAHAIRAMMEGEVTP